MSTFLVVLGWHGYSRHLVGWVEVRDAADRPTVHGTAPTIESDPALAVRRGSHQHPWSGAVPRPKHKATCVGRWDLRDENWKKIIQLHFQLASKRRSLQRNVIKKIVALFLPYIHLLVPCGVLGNPRSSLRV